MFKFVRQIWRKTLNMILELSVKYQKAQAQFKTLSSLKTWGVQSETQGEELTKKKKHDKV